MKKILLLRPVSKEIKGGHLRSRRIPYALFIVQELCRTHFETTLYDEMIEDGLTEEETLPFDINAFDYYLFLVNSTDFDRFSQLAASIADKSKILCLGQGPTGNPDNYNQYLCFFEDAELKVASYLFSKINSDGGVPPPADKFKDLPNFTLSQAELEKYHVYFPIIAQRKVIWGQVMASRGCPHRCTFCTSAIRESFGSSMRFSQVEKVLEQIQRHLANGANAIYFSDDDLTVSRKYLLELCQGLSQRNLKFPWTAHARVDEVDFEVLQAMKNSGCSLLRFGIESGSEKVIRLFKKTTHPEKWANQTLETFKACRKLKIPTAALFIIGAPNETWKDVFLSICLCFKIKPTLIQIHQFTPYDDTKFAKGNNLSSFQRNHYQFSDSGLSGFSRYEIVTIRTLFFATLFLSYSFYQQNLSYFGRFYLANFENTLQLLRSLPGFGLFLRKMPGTSPKG
jgi:radical SAM superfamily enzyme YgiQ (UPF0313 family)